MEIDSLSMNFVLAAQRWSDSIEKLKASLDNSLSSEIKRIGKLENYARVMMMVSCAIHNESIIQASLAKKAINKELQEVLNRGDVNHTLYSMAVTELANEKRQFHELFYAMGRLGLVQAETQLDTNGKPVVLTSLFEDLWNEKNT